jgi:hypothetical protein
LILPLVLTLVVVSVVVTSRQAEQRRWEKEAVAAFYDRTTPAPEAVVHDPAASAKWLINTAGCGGILLLEIALVLAFPRFGAPAPPPPAETIAAAFGRYVRLHDLVAETNRAWPFSLGSALADPSVRHSAEAMLDRHGTRAPLTAVEQVNARIDAGDAEGRDHWARIAHAIHALMVE